MAFSFGADLRAQIADLEGQVERYREALHGRITAAVESARERQKAEAEVAHAHRVIKQASEKFVSLTKELADLQKAKEGLEKAKMDFDDEQAELRREIRTLKDGAEGKEKQYQHLEGQAAEFEKELKEERERKTELQEKIRTLEEKAVEREEWIETCQDNFEASQKQVAELEKDKVFLANQRDLEKSHLKAEEESKRVLSTQYKNLRTDSDGVRAKLAAEQAETQRLKTHIDELKATITGLEHLQADLEEEKKTSEGLRVQWKRLADELPRFNPSPQLAVAPQVAPGPGPSGQSPNTLQSLAFELDCDGGSTPESSAESDASTTQRSNSASSNGESSSSSSDDDDDDTEIAEVEVHEGVRTVYVPGATMRIYIPYQSAAHNPFRCWIQVEINTGIVFRNWLLQATARAAPLLRRTARTQTVGSGASNPAIQSLHGSTSQPQDSTNGAAPTANQPPVQPQNDTNQTPPPPSATEAGTPPPTQGPNGNVTGPPASSTPQTNGNVPQPNPMGDVLDILGPGPQTDANGLTNGSPVPNGSSSTASSGAGPSNPPSLAMFVAASGNKGEQPQQPSPPVDARLKAVAELIEPVVPGEDNRPAFESGENLPHEANLPRSSWWNANVDSKSPPAAITLFAFALHLIFYYFLYVCYQNYCEREIWISANEKARDLLDILALRSQDGRGFASHLFSESVVRTIDNFVLAAFSLFKVETKPWPIPG